MVIDYLNVYHQWSPLTLMAFPSHLFIIVGNRADELSPRHRQQVLGRQGLEENSMGLFDRFKADQGQHMTPHLAFATSLIYCMGADGEMDNEEIGHLLSVLGGTTERGQIGVGANNRALLDQAVRIARTKPVDQFLLR
jgi:hypothetical protein